MTADPECTPARYASKAFWVSYRLANEILTTGDRVAAEV